MGDDRCDPVCDNSSGHTFYGQSTDPIVSTISFNRTSSPGQGKCCCEARLNRNTFLRSQGPDVLYSVLQITGGDRLWTTSETEYIRSRVNAWDYGNLLAPLTCTPGASIAQAMQCVRNGNTFPPSEKFKEGSIALVGDSITRYGDSEENMGWAMQLRSCYKGRYEVVNKGNPGWTTDDYLSLLEPVLKQFPSPTLITLMLGTNDAFKLSLSAYKNNLLKMMQIANSIHPGTRLLLITPPPPGSDPDTIHETMNDFRNAMLELSIATGTPVLDTWKVFLGPDARYDGSVMSKYLADGVHLNKDGNVALYEGLTAFLKEHWPEINP
ncbi:hypothetical protein, variant [Spizellomyces punctatus DAOM BR117]|nr:hypothetical protein, variant [Spizellomyces punctatus DAOM BR117]KNC99485.1 hypothetical protein, variant [Spizellomyces punctatus DAOM BR117]|eukprot:XP_016607525.1 hypothetical protein, variant [Spizellomyces punctatus DAOM BR117]